MKETKEIHQLTWKLLTSLECRKKQKPQVGVGYWGKSDTFPMVFSRFWCDALRCLRLISKQLTVGKIELEIEDCELLIGELFQNKKFPKGVMLRPFLSC